MSSCKPASPRDLLKVEVATVRYGELAALGMLERGALRLDIFPTLNATKSNDTVINVSIHSGEAVWWGSSLYSQIRATCPHVNGRLYYPHNDTIRSAAKGLSAITGPERLRKEGGRSTLYVVIGALRWN